MADLLLELFSEEIPSGMQARAAQDLARLVGDGLKEAGLESGEVKTFYGARRLTLVIEGLAEKSADVSEERKGPRVGSPDKAIEGFLRGVGIDSIDQADVISDEKKGDFYVARIEKPGRVTSEILAEIVPNVIRSFPWPKSQRWGSGSLRWVRPLHSILCLLGGKVVPFEVDGIKSGNETLGHRFMSEGTIKVSDFADYEKKLRAAHVILDADDRQKIILEGAKAAAKKAGLELVEDDALLAEAAGLVEWPVVLMGEFDQEFLDVPPEVIITAIRKHQKCFSVTGKGGKLANNFILVANIDAQDGGKEIIDGNERVVRARLSDAKFFWDQDRKVKLEDRLDDLKDIIFHEKLGTQAERVERLKALARELAPIVGADPDKAERAAELCKADLVTGMVGEFPDLQGLMGKYYALDQGEDKSVVLAIEEHYKPVGQSDSVPTDPVSIAVALADKLDTLVGFWAIDEKPTGSKDPYALRRAALGVIRIVLENELPIRLRKYSLAHHPRIYQRISLAFRLLTRDSEGYFQYPEFWRDISWPYITPDGDEVWPLNEFEFTPDQDVWVDDESHLPPNDENAIPDGLFSQTLMVKGEIAIDRRAEIEARSFRIVSTSRCATDLLAFFHDRLKVYLRDRGARHDLIDAVISPDADDLLMIVARVEALGKFLDTDDGANLLAGVKRAANILRIEEKKHNTHYSGKPDANAMQDKFEQHLWNTIQVTITEAEDHLADEDFVQAMDCYSQLRSAVDAFFDKVTVNAEDSSLRENRLKLLNQIREATLSVADFSKIEG